MPSVTYMNQSAPFWDFVASLEQQGRSHPFFSQNQNDSSENTENTERGDEGHPFGPWGWGFPRGFPHRGPPPHGHGRNHHGPPPHRHETEERDERKEDEKAKDNENGNGEGPSNNSGSDSEGRRHGRGRRGHCGGGRRGHHGFGAHPGHGHGHGHGRGGFGPRPWFNPLDFAAGLFDTSNTKDSNENQDFTPEADIFDTSSAYVVHISLPGAKKEDVGVNWDAEKSELSIAGVVYRPGDEDFLKTLAMNERKVGPFERKIRLGTRASPAKIDAEGITAKLEDGVLRVEVPKMEMDFVEIRKVDIE